MRTFRMKPGVSMMVRLGQWRYLPTVEPTDNISHMSQHRSNIRLAINRTLLLFLP